MNFFKEVNTVNPGDTKVSLWVDRFTDDDFIDVIGIALYADQNGTVTIDESDLMDVTPTVTHLVNAASITQNIMYTSAKLTLTKRYYRVSFSNTSESIANFIVRTKAYDVILNAAMVEQDDADLLKVDANMQVDDTDVSNTNPMPSRLLGNNVQVGSDATATWANNALINTAVNVDITIPTLLQTNGLYLVNVYNPSVSALTVIAQNVFTALGGSTRYAELTRWNVPAGITKPFLVQGWLLGDAARLVLSNDTALGASEGFTANIRIITV